MEPEKATGGQTPANDAAERFRPKPPAPPPPPGNAGNQSVPPNYKPFIIAGIGIFVLGIAGGILGYQLLTSRRAAGEYAAGPASGSDDRLPSRAMKVSDGGTPYQVEASTPSAPAPDRMMFASSSSGTFSSASFTVGSADTIQKNVQNVEPQLQRILQKYGDRPIVKEIMADLMKNPAMQQVRDKLGPNATPAAVMAAMPDPQAMMPVAQKYMARPEFISVLQEIIADPEVGTMMSAIAPGMGKMFGSSGAITSAMKQASSAQTPRAKAGKRSAKKPESVQSSEKETAPSPAPSVN